MDKLKTIREIKASTENHKSHPLSLQRLQSTIRLGFKDLWNNRLRSLLTVLGLVFGVCSVIAMLAIGEGAKYEAQQMILQLGSNNIIVKSVKPPEENNSTNQTSRLAAYGITYSDVDRIRETIPGVEVKVPARIIRKDVWNGAENVSAEIYGTVPWYPQINNHRVSMGRFFGNIEFREKTNVCVISAGIAERLFPMDAPVGRSIRTGSQYYTVVGVMQPKSVTGSGDSGLALPTASAQSSSGGSDGGEGEPNRVFIPLSATKERFGEVIAEYTSGSRTFERVELNEVTVQVAESKDVLRIADAVEAAFEMTHDKKDYEVIVPLAQLEMAERQNQIFNIVLGGIAALSMLVGGIGIMNIMLASVTERTREIGIRRALGATRGDIITQFLVETVILSGIGGMIGVALGIMIAVMIELLAKMPTIVTVWSPLMAFSISAMVGVVFGIYPATRAANMDPVEALRHE